MDNPENSLYMLDVLNNICCMDRIIPEAVHNPIAIKLLVFGLLYWHVCYIRLFFFNLTCFVLISL